MPVLYKSFVLIFLQFLFFGKHSMDFIHVWHDDRTLSKILLNPVIALKVKVTDFELLCQSFSVSVFAKASMDMIHVWHK